MATIRQRIREDVLKRHGLVKAKGRGLKPKPKKPPPSLAGVDLVGDGRKTLTMLLLEAQLDCPIEEILSAGSLSVLSRELGLSRSCISKWRQRLGVR